MLTCVKNDKKEQHTVNWFWAKTTFRYVDVE